MRKILNIRWVILIASVTALVAIGGHAHSKAPQPIHGSPRIQLAQAPYVSKPLGCREESRRAIARYREACKQPQSPQCIQAGTELDALCERCTDACIR
jgi:hypothetical protein